MKLFLDFQVRGLYNPQNVTKGLKFHFKENYKFMETLFTELRQVFQDEYIHLGKHKMSGLVRLQVIRSFVNLTWPGNLLDPVLKI